MLLAVYNLSSVTRSSILNKNKILTGILYVLVPTYLNKIYLKFIIGKLQDGIFGNIITLVFGNILYS